MPRPPRDLKPNYCYHITVRCNNREFKLSSHECREVFLYAIKKAQDKFNRQCQVSDLRNAYSIVERGVVINLYKIRKRLCVKLTEPLEEKEIRVVGFWFITCIT